MLDFLLSLLLGWPMIAATAVVASLGLFKANVRLLIASAVMTVPFSWFLSGFPALHSPVFLLPLFPFSSAWVLHRGHEMLAWLVAVPFFLVILLLFYVVMAQPA